MEKLLEQRRYEGQGMDTAVEGGSWNVMFLNYLPRLGYGGVDNMHMHTETKETFVLLAGKAMLFVAEGEGRPGDDIKGVWMEPGQTYTVKAGVWHCNMMSEDAKFLLVENADTTTDNTFREKLTEAQIAHVHNLAKPYFA